MNRAQNSQLVSSRPEIISNGFFACGILTDYRADWALVNNFEQQTINLNTIQRNPG
jgi:hypothetical protein